MPTFWRCRRGRGRGRPDSYLFSVSEGERRLRVHREETTMQRIVPNLWFDHKAAEAAESYTKAFTDARIVETVHYPTEGLADFHKEFAGDVLYVAFEIRGYRFIAINAGPDVQVNPSISLMLNFDHA